MKRVSLLQIGLLIAGFMTASGSAPIAQAPAAVDVQIEAPKEDAYVNGLTRLAASVTPESAVSGVTFSVDGRQVCAITRPPFSCEWDAGKTVRAHQIRMVASLVAGGRVVRNVSTRALENLFSLSVDLVQVTTVVIDGNRFVRDLPQDAFQVFEDDLPQTVTQFSSENVPLDLVVAVDVSTSMTPAMPAVKSALRAFLGAIAPGDRVTLLGFNETIYTLTRRETDPDERMKAVDGLHPSGATALYDVIIRSLDLLGRQPGRKVLVVFTDGEDHGSNAGLPQVERALRSSDVTLFMIGEGRALENLTLRRGMQKLTDPTGGRSLFIKKADDLRAVFADLRSELSNQYLLGYESTNANKDGKWRRIRVQVSGRGQVRAREGYFGPQP